MAYEEPEYPSLLRSEAMSLTQLYIPTEAAHATVHELALMKRIQFKDLNADVNPFQRTYVGELRRLDECERRLRYLTDKIESATDSSTSAASPISIRPYAETQADGLTIDELDPKLKSHEERVLQLSNTYETQLRRMAEFEEARHVLRETATFFREAETRSSLDNGTRRGSSMDDQAPLLQNAMEQGQIGGLSDGSGFPPATGGFELEFVAGTIDRARMPTFERVLWRVLRGNLYMNWGSFPSISWLC